MVEVPSVSSQTSITPTRLAYEESMSLQSAGRMEMYIGAGK